MTDDTDDTDNTDNIVNASPPKSNAHMPKLLNRLGRLGRYTPGDWWATAGDELPFDDFCREIIAPGANEDYPLGVLGIRTDDDFWSVAALPPEAIALPLSEIVSTLWPEVEKPQLQPDSGSEERRKWWAEICAKIDRRRRRAERSAKNG